MLELIFLLRLVHVVAGVGWAGELLTVNFVLLPALLKARADERVTLLQTVFLYVFRLARRSAVSPSSAASGCCCGTRSST